MKYFSDIYFANKLIEICFEILIFPLVQYQELHIFKVLELN